MVQLETALVLFLVVCCKEFAHVDACCGCRLSAESGEFQSPGYGDIKKYPYEKAMVCDTIIEVPEGKVIVLQFTDFNLPGARFGDYVKVGKDIFAFFMLQCTMCAKHLRLSDIMLSLII